MRRFIFKFTFGSMFLRRNVQCEQKYYTYKRRTTNIKHIIQKRFQTYFKIIFVTCNLFICMPHIPSYLNVF